jgi:hypothetical protein
MYSKIILNLKIFFSLKLNIYVSGALSSSSDDSCNTGWACGNKLVRANRGQKLSKLVVLFNYKKKISKIFYTSLLRLGPMLKLKPSLIDFIAMLTIVTWDLIHFYITHEILEWIFLFYSTVPIVVFFLNPFKNHQVFTQ